MYFYIVDALLRDKKYARSLARIESRLLSLGIQGKSEKLTILKSMSEVAESALKRGAETIVAIGNDGTFNKLLAIMEKRDVVLGYIPVEDTPLARSLGIPPEARACDVLSSRTIKHLDIGKANTVPFLSHLSLSPAKELLLELDGGTYHVETTSGTHSLTIYNVGGHGKSPRDGVLEAEIQQTEDGGAQHFWNRKTVTTTFLPFRTMRIKSLAGVTAGYADGQTMVKTPMTVKVLTRALRVIVGKDRSFS